MATTRLYYTDSYLTSFDARVEERAEGGLRVYLDRTAFYPLSGGQQSDRGVLGGIEVTDVVDEGERIAHVLASPLPESLDTVAGRIDWARRFDHMQQHTGQHLLSAVFAELFGHRTVSVHFGSDSSSLDLDVESVSRERLLEAEARANAAVFENRPVEVAFEEAGEATGLRKESTREGTLRIVTIPGLDRSACGGTHVRATGETGAILIRKLDKVRKSARVEFVCGTRAVRRARADFEALDRIAGSLSASPDEVAALVAAQSEQLKALDSERRKLEREVAGYRARALYETTPPDEKGLRRATVRRDAGTMEDLRALAQAYVAQPRSLFAGVLAAPPSVVLAASEDSGIDAARTLRDVLTPAGGRGGGSPRLAQGSVPNVAQLDAVLEAVRRA
jgi:alanyl-tRNA synthetase